VSLLQQWLTKQAEQRAESVVVVLKKERVTYGELEEDSNRLARLLQANGCRRGDRVCFLMPKAPAAILSQLAILKADCTYVPLDAGSPAPRLEAGIDTGPVVFQRTFPVGEDDTALTVYTACIRAGVSLIQRLLDTDPARLPLTPQDLTRREYFSKQIPADGCVRWERGPRANFTTSCGPAITFRLLHPGAVCVRL
jgi:non-ribosomal peptide synthetase component F